LGFRPLGAAAGAGAAPAGLPGVQPAGPAPRRLRPAPFGRTSVTTPNEQERTEPDSIRCGLYRIAPEGAARAGLVRPGDELVLWVEAPAYVGTRWLLVELWRGDRLRDRWGQRLERGAGRNVVFRLCWGEGGSSSRLTCRVLLDGREVARQTALL